MNVISTKNLISGGHQAHNLRWLSDQIQRVSEKFQGLKKLSQSENESNRAIISSQCVATGWGRYKTHGSMVPTLLQATVPLHDNSLCQAKYGNSIPIKKGHLCAGHLDGTTGTCVVGTQQLIHF